jgi:hypothetical protein
MKLAKKFGDKFGQRFMLGHFRSGYDALGRIGERNSNVKSIDFLTLIDEAEYSA